MATTSARPAPGQDEGGLVGGRASCLPQFEPQGAPGEGDQDQEDLDDLLHGAGGWWRRAPLYEEMLL